MSNLTQEGDIDPINTNLTADGYEQVNIHLRVVKTKLCVSPNVSLAASNPVPVYVL